MVNAGRQATARRGLTALLVAAAVASCLTVVPTANAQDGSTGVESPGGSIPVTDHGDHEPAPGSDQGAESSSESALPTEPELGEGGAGGHDHGPTTDPEHQDLVVTTNSTANGLEVLVSQPHQRWVPQRVAVLQPGGYDEDDWISNSCISGSGRFAAVVMGPRQATNIPAALDRGGVAYAVDLANGAVRPLINGVSLYYHSPGCGTGNVAAFVRYLDVDQAATEVYTGDLSTGVVTKALSQHGQLTSAVPVGDAIVAVQGAEVVRLVAGERRSIAAVDGQAFELRPNDVGSVDFQVHHGEHRPSEIRRFMSGEARIVATGPADRLRLFGGRNGRNTIVGAEGEAVERPVEGSMRRLRAPEAWVDDVSFDGSVIVQPGSGLTERRAVRFGDAETGATVATTELMPSTEHQHVDRLVSLVPPPASAFGGSGGRSADGSDPVTRANTTVPKCAVERNRTDRQVPQPTPDQVWWAVQQASAGNLKSPNFTRPAGYLNTTQPAYGPSTDFPLVALDGNAGKRVPPQLAAAVFMQESNLQQASRRVLPGESGNPAIPNYYGDDQVNNPLSRIDYDKADCGYGVAQVTSWMTTTLKDAPLWTTDKQIRVALDYTENVAAGIWVLSQKWNEVWRHQGLAGSPVMKINNGDSDDPSSWYFALWAYNTGVHPVTETSPPVLNGPNPEGIRPHGLGWTNNPRNADWRPNRHPFLSRPGNDFWKDAIDPSDWAYQERVLGYLDNGPRFEKRSPWGCSITGCGSFVPPGPNTFCDASNQCSPDFVPADPKLSFCTRLNDRMCWWYKPVNQVNFGPLGIQFTTEFSGEPGWAAIHPPNCSLDTDPKQNDPPATAVIVDNTLDKRTVRQGCNNASWTNQGRFDFFPGTNASGVPIGVIDWHQLGVGWGGHVWFTKNKDAAAVGRPVNTGRWTPPATLAGWHEVRVHVPDAGASTENAVYKLYPSGGGGPAIPISRNQHLHRNEWVSLGTFDLRAGAYLELTNLTGEVDYARNVAFDAVAFIAGTKPCTTGTGVDTDGDHLPDSVENANGLLANDADTDDDGLPDAWEANPSWIGAGVYLPGQSCPVTTRDELFGPYGTRASVTEKGEIIGSDSRYNRPPDPRHKDLYLEIDWQSCNLDNTGCPIMHIGIGDFNIPKFIDPAYHLPPRAAIEDLVNTFGSTTKVANPDGRKGVNLNVLIDEKTKHWPTCDQPPADSRGRYFGRPEQRKNAQIIAAKSMAFRYVWSGHSTRHPTHEACPTPTAMDLLFHRPLPEFDNTPYGAAHHRGRDILLSLSLSWWCPSDLRFMSMDGPGALPNLLLVNSPCINITTPLGFTKVLGADGIYPKATLKTSETGQMMVSWPMTMLLGVDEAEGTRQLWGRSMMRLLGYSLGVPEAGIGNDPQALSGTRTGLRPQDFGSWEGAAFAPPPDDGRPVANEAAYTRTAAHQTQDLDGDTVIEQDDNCPGVPNSDQKRSSSGLWGDACEPDRDGDGIAEKLIDIGWGSETGQIDTAPGDTDNDGTPNATDTDDDGDGRPDASDNCPLRKNVDQANHDNDSLGNACDFDDDNDEYADDAERLTGSDPLDSSSRPEVLDTTRLDELPGSGSTAVAASAVATCSDGTDDDGDGLVDGADSGCVDTDGDTMPDVADNCPTMPNFGWRNSDDAPAGDTCEGVRIVGVTVPGSSNYVNQSGMGVVTWATVHAGTAELRLNSTSCANGSVIPIATSPPPPVPDPEHDHPVSAFTVYESKFPMAGVNAGPNTVRVCQRDTAGVLRDDLALFDNGPTGHSGFHALPPARILDTRNGTGFTGPLGPSATKQLAVLGKGGVPASGVAGVMVTITTTGATAPSHLTVWPAGGPVPTASTLNFVAGQTIANLAPVRLGTDGKISVFNNAGTTHVIADVVGWFDDGTSLDPALMTPVDPYRLVDSRIGLGTVLRPWDAGEKRQVKVTGFGGVPADATNVLVNITAVSPTAESHLTVWAAADPAPPSSAMNFRPGFTQANLVSVKVGAGGAIEIANSSGKVDLVIDVVGYHRLTSTGNWYHPIVPSRVLDSRDNAGTMLGAWHAGEARDVTIVGGGAVPSNARAVLANVTVLGGAVPSHLTTWPAGKPRPTASTINVAPGQAIANLAVLSLNNGRVGVFNNAGDVHIIIDVVGWYG